MAEGKKDKGFSLIELLVVVIIIGILAAIAIPIYIGVQNNAKDSAVKSDLSNAKIAVVAYYTDKGAGCRAVAPPPASARTASRRSNTASIAFKGTPSSTAFCIDAVCAAGHPQLGPLATAVSWALSAP